MDSQYDVEAHLAQASPHRLISLLVSSSPYRLIRVVTLSPYQGFDLFEQHLGVSKSLKAGRPLHPRHGMVATNCCFALGEGVWRGAEGIAMLDIEIEGVEKRIPTFEERANTRTDLR